MNPGSARPIRKRRDRPMFALGRGLGGGRPAPGPDTSVQTGESNMRKSVVRCCLGALFMVLLAVPLTAQPGGGPGQPAKPSENQLTLDGLKTMLEGMGYDAFKEYKDDKGQLTSFDLTIVSKNWDF